MVKLSVHAMMKLSLTIILILLTQYCGGKPVKYHEVSTLENGRVSVSFKVQSFDLYHGNSICHGEGAGFYSTGIRLEYVNSSSSNWVRITDEIILLDSGEVHFFPDLDGSCLVIRAVQQEHGGGPCNCWRIDSLFVNSSETRFGCLLFVNVLCACIRMCIFLCIK